MDLIHKLGLDVNVNNGERQTVKGSGNIQAGGDININIEGDLISADSQQLPLTGDTAYFSESGLSLPVADFCPAVKGEFLKVSVKHKPWRLVVLLNHSDETKFVQSISRSSDGRIDMACVIKNDYSAEGTSGVVRDIKMDPGSRTPEHIVLRCWFEHVQTED